MNLVPVSKNNSFADWQSRMNDFFSHWLPSTRREPNFDDFFAPFQWDSSLSFGPSIDVVESETDVLVRAEIPGLKKDEFSIELNNNQLTIRGEKKQEKEEKDRNFHRTECSYGCFSRSVYLPCEVDSDKAVAEYSQGVLKVKLPKAESSQRKQIAVKVH